MAVYTKHLTRPGGNRSASSCSNWASVSRSSAISTHSRSARTSTGSTCCFYHLKLRCFVVIDLKITLLKLEYVGKMNFYLAAVDWSMRSESRDASGTGTERIPDDYSARSPRLTGPPRSKLLRKFPIKFLPGYTIRYPLLMGARVHMR